MQAYHDVLVHQRAATRWITINRPERRNALRRTTIEELTSAFTEAAGDPGTLVIVLTGAGDRAFCAGGDFSEDTGDETGAAPTEFAMRLLALSVVMRGCPKPVIARIDGWAVTAGNELQLVCDLAIASDRSRFRQGGPDVGSVPAWWGAQMLPLLMGERRAREAILLAREYSAAEAEQVGLINRSVPPEHLDRELGAWCDQLAAMSPVALRHAKSLVNANSNRSAGALLDAYDHLPEVHGARGAMARIRSGGIDRARATQPPAPAGGSEDGGPS
jgi:1,4-dihydroxy-2-naphthoyl-CoA synthase